MRWIYLVFSLLFFVTVPATQAGTVKFTPHSQTCTSNCNPAVSFEHADLNSDGREDLIWVPASYGGQDLNFYVQLATADGVYGNRATYDIPQGKCGSTTVVTALAVGDFNGDGHADVAAVGSDGYVYLYLNSGKGALALSKTAYGFSNCASLGSPVAVAADFNHDGKLDLALSVNNQLQILLGNGKGGFTAGPVTNLDVSENLALGDFDGDGHADLATWSYDSGSIYAQIAYGDGTGHFPQIVETTLPTAYTDLVSFGDVNNDGRTDIIVLYATKKQAGIFAGTAARTFGSPTSVTLANCGVDAAMVGDFDGNGVNDLVVPEGTCGSQGGPYTLDFVGHNTNGSFATDQPFYTFNWGFTTRTVMLHADGNMKPDLYVSPCTDGTCEVNTTATLLNETSGSFPACQAPDAFVGIHVCAPASGASVASPVSFQIGVAGPVPMRDVEVWIDGKKQAEQIAGFSNYTFFNEKLSIKPGSHTASIFGAGIDQSLVHKSVTFSVK